MPFSLNFWMLAETLRLNLAPALPRITCPTLIVRSASDPYLTEREVMDMAHAIKNARTVTIAGEGHFLARKIRPRLPRSSSLSYNIHENSHLQRYVSAASERRCERGTRFRRRACGRRT